MKLEAEREAGAAAERSAEPEERAHPFDPLVSAGGLFGQASPPTMPKVPELTGTGVAIEPGAGLPRAKPAQSRARPPTSEGSEPTEGQPTRSTS